MYSQKFFLVYLKEVQMVFKEQEAWGESGPGMCPILTHYCLSACVCSLHMYVPGLSPTCSKCYQSIHTSVNIMFLQLLLHAVCFACIYLNFSINNLCTFKDLPFACVLSFCEASY